MLTNHVAEFLFPNFVERIRQVENGIKTIEIINNTRRDIEGKIWERSDWGGGGDKFKSRMFTHSRCPRQKSHFGRVFLLFEMFFLVKILKISFQIV